MQSIPMATLGFLLITAAMVLLSVARTRVKGHGAEVLAWFRRTLRPVAEESESKDLTSEDTAEKGAAKPGGIA
jgi:hypothetical protein